MTQPEAMTQLHAVMNTKVCRVTTCALKKYTIHHNNCSFKPL